MHNDVIIIGAGENGSVVANSLTHQYTILGFLDDHRRGKNVLGGITAAARYVKKAAFFVSVGDNNGREVIIGNLRAAGARFVNAIHPLAKYEKSVILGENVFLGAYTYVNVGSAIGDGVMVNNGCIVEHDNKIGAYSHLAPGVITGGRVTIGVGTFVGLGARINDHLTIGAHATIGSGAVVITNLPDGVTAVGVPAKPLSRS